MRMIERRMEMKGLRLPDGQQADSLRVGPLYQALVKAGVPGVTPFMGKYDLLVTYRDHVAQQPAAYDYGTEFIKAAGKS